MKKVCGTCNFQLASIANGNGIEILCAHDDKRHKANTPGCDKWVEYNSRLSPQERISLVASDRQTSLALEANRLATEANNSAREANRIASETNSFTRRSRRLDRIMTIIAIAIAMISARVDIMWLISWVLKKIIKSP